MPPMRPTPPSPAVLGVGAAVGDAAHGVVPAEKESEGSRHRMRWGRTGGWAGVGG